MESEAIVKTEIAPGDSNTEALLASITRAASSATAGEGLDALAMLLESCKAPEKVEEESLQDISL